MRQCCLNLTEEEEQFVKFIESFSDYYKPAYIVSDNILNTKKGRNQFKLYSLDDICQSFDMAEGNIGFTPKTADAIWCKKGNDGIFTIFLFEFKGDKITNFSSKFRFCEYIQKLIEKKQNSNFGEEQRNIQIDIDELIRILGKYSDTMLNGLILKPLETITVSLPLIYNCYYEINKNKEGIEHIDIVNFLRKTQIIYKVICYYDSGNDYRERALSRRSGNYSFELRKSGCKKVLENYDIEISQELTENYQDNLNTFYLRYNKAKIINNKIFEYFESEREFNNFFKNICLKV